MLDSFKKKATKFLRRVVKDAVLDALEHDSAQIQRHIQVQAVMSSAAFAYEHLPLDKGMLHRDQLFDLCLDRSPSDGLILEFGVFRGDSIRYLAGKVPDRKVFGFDSFEGLAEPWIFNKPGLFELEKGELPKVPANVHLIKGWFSDSLLGFLGSHPGKIAFLHIDSDLYSSCRYVLEAVANRIVPGTIVMFDEYYNYPGWERGEHLAFREWIERWQVEFEYIGFTIQSSVDWWKDGSTGQQLAVKILKIADDAISTA